MTEDRKASSHQFADQIRQLEVEGSRLMSASSNLGDSLGLSTSTRVQSAPMDGGSASLGTSLRALADISAEQKTIETMRHQLDAQSKETERLSKDLLGSADSNGFRFTGGSGSLLDKLDIPTASRSSGRAYGKEYTPSGAYASSTDGTYGGSSSGAYGGTAGRLNPSTPSMNGHAAANTSGTGASEDLQYMTRLQLERALRDCRQDVTSIRDQMAGTMNISEKQKEHYRQTIDDLRGKLQQALAERDMVTGNKNREAATQEAKIYKLQQQSEHLEQVNQRQEETLSEQKKRLDVLQREQYTADLAVSQVRSLVLELERTHGRSLYDGTNLSSQDASQVISALEKCVRGLDAELQKLTRHNRQLSTELEEIKVLAEEKCRIMAQEHHERVLGWSRMSQMQTEHDQHMDVTSERSLNAKQQVAALQEQLQTIQRQTDQQLHLKEEYISELEARLRVSKDDGEDERRAWRGRKDALELACDNAQKELSLVKQEREDAIRQAAVMDSRYTDMQRTIQKLESEADAVSAEKRRLVAMERDVSVRDEQLKGTLAEKDREVGDLRRALDTVRQECSNQLQQTVSSLEKEGKLLVAEENKLLTTQLTSVTEKCHRLTVESELGKSQQQNLREKYDDLKAEYNSVKEQMQSAVTSKSHLSELVASRAAECDRNSAERDRYLRLLETHGGETADLKATREKLTIQLEEREKNCVLLQQERDKMADAAESSNKSRQEVQEERDDLLQRMNEKIIETEELRHARDALSKKLRLREGHVTEIQGDNVKLAQELHSVRGEAESVTAEKESLLDELKESRYDVSNLKDEITTLQRRLGTNKGDMGKEINKLSLKLKNTEHDLRLARKALKTREQVDGTAVKVAGKMQKAVTEKRGQIDSLQSRIRWLEDCVDTTTKEKQALGEESVRLSQTVKRSVEQNSRLRGEVKEYVRKNGDLRDAVNKMEAALEKAAVRHASSQAQVQQYEQDLARLKLRHQLQVKELERSGRQKSTRSREHVLDEDLARHTQPAVDSAINEDLRALVGEMRAALSSHSAKHTPAVIGHAGDGYPPSGSVDFPPQGTKSDQEVLQEVLAQYRDRQPDTDIDTYIKGNMRPTKLSSSSKPPNGKSSRHHRSTNGRADNRYRSTNGDDLETVSDLLTSHTHELAPLVTDVKTQELCKRLEKKIENLTKIGGDLAQDNRDLSALMKEDKKLKKGRVQMVK